MRLIRSAERRQKEVPMQAGCTGYTGHWENSWKTATEATTNTRTQGAFVLQKTKNKTEKDK